MSAGRMAAIATPAALLATAFATSGVWTVAVLVAALGVVWAANALRGRAAPAAVAGLTACTVIGVWLDLPPVWMLLAMIGVLAAWDLDAFALRLDQAQRVTDVKTMRQAHVRRLLVVLAVGAALGVMALYARIELSFAGALLLGLAAIALLGPALGSLRRKNG